MDNNKDRAEVNKESSESEEISTVSKSRTLATNLQPEAVYEKMYDWAEKLASTKLGQFTIGKIDRVLSTVEDTAKWSLPNTESAQRPLPWIPFLTMIVLLRAIRISLSVGAILIGNEPVTARELIYFIQTRRRKLRAIKYQGLRTIRINTSDSKNDFQQGIISQLNSLLGSIMCRSGKLNGNDEHDQVQIIVKNSKKSSLQNRNKKNDNKNERSSLNTMNTEDIHNGHDKEDEDEIAEDQDSNTSDDPDYDPENDCSEESDDEIAEYNTVRKNLEEDLLEFTKRKGEENIEKHKNIIDELINEKRGEIEEELKSKLEFQIEERIRQHASMLLNKVDEKLGEYQQKEGTSVLRNLPNIQLPTQNGGPDVPEEDQYVEESASNRNNGNSSHKNLSLEDILLDGDIHKGKGVYIEDDDKNCPSKEPESGSSSNEDIFYSPIGSPKFIGNFDTDNTSNGIFSKTTDYPIINSKFENFDNKTLIKSETEAAAHQKINANTERRGRRGKAPSKQEI